MSTFIKSFRYAIVVLFVSATYGCGGGIQINPPPRPDDAQYIIQNVIISGPAKILIDPTRYTVSFEVVVQTDGGAVSPVVSLIDSDGGLRFGDDWLEQRSVSVGQIPMSRGVHPVTATLELSCTPTFDVRGNLESSEEGGRVGNVFPFDFIDEAEVYAHVSRKDGSGGVSSIPMDVDCNQP